MGYWVRVTKGREVGAMRDGSQMKKVEWCEVRVTMSGGQMYISPAWG